MSGEIKKKKKEETKRFIPDIRQFCHGVCVSTVVKQMLALYVHYDARAGMRVNRLKELGQPFCRFVISCLRSPPPHIPYFFVVRIVAQCTPSYTNILQQGLIEEQALHILFVCVELRKS